MLAQLQCEGALTCRNRMAPPVRQLFRVQFQTRHLKTLAGRLRGTSSQSCHRNMCVHSEFLKPGKAWFHEASFKYLSKTLLSVLSRSLRSPHPSVRPILVLSFLFKKNFGASAWSA